MSFIVLLAGVQALHMFGGMQSPTGFMRTSELVVIGSVTSVKPLPDQVGQVRIKVLDAPCAPRGFKRPKELVLVELGDHVAGYQAGDRVIFPLHRAKNSPHRPASVDGETWSVEQAAQEVVRVDEKDASTGKLVRALCEAQGPDVTDALIAILRSKNTRLAGGAAKDLMMNPQAIPRRHESIEALAALMADTSQAAGVRLAAITVAGRSDDGMLQQAVAERVRSDETVELVAAAMRSCRRELLAERIALVLGGPFGPGRAAVLKSGFTRKPEHLAELEKLVDSGPPDVVLACEALGAVDPSAKARHATCGAR